MRLSNGSFPYPVIGLPDAISENALMPEVRVVDHLPPKQLLTVPYRWDFEISLNNPDIEELVRAGKASFLCEAMCSATFLRRCWKQREASFGIELDRKDVNRRVEFSLWVVADERLPDYRNSAAHPDYADLEPFDLAQGAPLAFLKSYSWDADLIYEDLTSLRSILKIEKCPDPAAEYPNVSTDGDYVSLYLPAMQYAEFLSVASSEGINSVLHSSLLLFAVQTGLVRYKQHEDSRWARAIRRIVEARKNDFVGYELGNAEQASDMALRLLDNPTRKLGEHIVDLAKAAVAAQGMANDEEE